MFPLRDMRYDATQKFVCQFKKLQTIYDSWVFAQHNPKAVTPDFCVKPFTQPHGLHNLL